MECVCEREQCKECEKCEDCDILCDCVLCTCKEETRCTKCELIDKSQKMDLIRTIDMNAGGGIQSPDDIIDYFYISLDRYIQLTFIVLHGDRRFLIWRDVIRFKEEAFELSKEEMEPILKRFMN